ncbi:GDSL-like lipase/acylhydrolase family protein [Stackebrandtia albiflava]|uniref:GDSL-like lipase/acylhydrolase family protein n=1 Tax=Stackebrandtia albiflava TaxID=406432 RepID=A0A562UL27_9ACTN|nr:SGNH/GDSL hydrolase family protein [Stackebrandtia albiflava]TWJ06314.1 GDSL-like lipase/acylhydrolase family protein [Stackebrandtia albiflava]
MSPRLRGLVAALTVAAMSLPVSAGTAHAADPSRYVALGDSFVAGPVIPDQGGSPLGCLRSDRNYPSLLAERVGAGEFVDVSCTGAQTEDMFAPQTTTLGTNPAQLDAVTADTTLVTVGIGGNDVGFADIMINCIKKGALNPLGNPCERQYTGTGVDELRQRIADTADDIAAVFAAIRERAPGATVLAVGYPAILPESRGCWPKVTLARGDVAYLDGVEQALNTTIADLAADHGVQYVDVFTRGHDVCQDEDVRWIEGVVPTQPAAPIHPNAKGMAAVAGMVSAHLDS